MTPTMAGNPADGRIRRMLIGGALVAGRELARADPEPAHRRADPRGARGLRRPRSTPPSPPRRGAFDAWSRTTPGRALRRAPPHRRPHRGRGRRLRRARGAELRQADQRRAERRDPGDRRLLALLRRRRALPARGRRRRVPRRPHLDDPPRPGRRRRLDRALELPADDDGLEARPGARRRQHRGLQALRADAADRAEARRASSPRNCPPASSTSSPAAAPASAARWSTTPAST